MSSCDIVLVALVLETTNLEHFPYSKMLEQDGGLFLEALWPYEFVQQPKSSMTQRSTDRTQGMFLLAA